MNATKELNGNRSNTKPFKNSSPSIKKVVTIVSPKEELVSITPNERNWRGICIALLVIVAVLALILFFIVLLSPPYEGPFNPGIKFTIDHVTGSEFKSSSFNGTWISGTEFVFRDSEGGVSIFDAKNNSVRIFMNNSTFRMYNGVDFTISADMKFILIVKDMKKVHTNTKKAKYRIQDVYSPNQIPLTPFLFRNAHNQEIPFIQEVMWSPRGNALVFVYQNNIFYKPQAMSNSIIYQITYTGSESIYNGVADWLYQEEITKTRKCMWFSSDGRYLAFATFNDSLVGVFKYPVFKTNHNYPEIFSLSYPKVGTTNPEVTISVADLHENKNGSYISIKKPVTFSNTSNVYFVNMVWNKLNKIAVIWMNREQTISVVSVCSEPFWTCQDISIVNVTYESGWAEPSVDLIFSNKDNNFITILSVLDGSGRYPQICHVNVETKVFTPITHGQIVVTSIKAWDQTNHVIYFEAAPEGKPSQRHLYNVSDSLLLSNKWHCLTCPVLPILDSDNDTSSNNISSLFLLHSSVNGSKENDSVHWPLRSNSCRFVKSHFHHFDLPITYYILECLGPDVPKILIMDVTLNVPTFLLNNQTELAERYAQMAKPQIKILQVELETGYQAQVKLLLPPVLRERIEIEFPFILYIGTLPGGQGVTEEWTVDWNTYLVSSHNFVVGVVDARGSGGQSDEMKYEIQKKIGIVDIEDQLSVLLYLEDNLKFIDKSRTGVWGSGYGGYVTGRLLEQDNGTFQCGIAVAPITSWAHYVSVWTERFMGTPSVTDNYRGYEEADLTKKAAQFKDKKLLLIHGTADKLVHYQHSMLLVHSFSKHGVLFTQLTYPDEDHQFSKSNHHLIRAMETFWNECFGPTEYEEYDEGLSFLNFAQ